MLLLQSQVNLNNPSEVQLACTFPLEYHQLLNITTTCAVRLIRQIIETKHKINPSLKPRSSFLA